MLVSDNMVLHVRMDASGAYVCNARHVQNRPQKLPFADSTPPYTIPTMGNVACNASRVITSQQQSASTAGLPMS